MKNVQAKTEPVIVLDSRKLLLLGGLPNESNNVMMGPKPGTKSTVSPSR